MSVKSAFSRTKQAKIQLVRKTGLFPENECQSILSGLKRFFTDTSQKRYLTLRQWLKEKFIRFGAFWGKYHRRLARITFDNTIESRRDYRKTPRQVEARKLLFTTAIPIVIFVMRIYYYRGLLSASTFGGPSEAVTNLLAVITTIIVFLLGRYFFLRAGASEEKSAKKLYFSEFEDLLRHINANLKVMVQLQYELDQSNEDCSVIDIPADSRPPIPVILGHLS